MAEAIFQKLLVEHDLGADISCESAGTSGYHEGHLADRRMREYGKKRGYNLLTRSRQVSAHDFDEFDYILVADEKNYNDLMSFPNYKKEIVSKMLDYSDSHRSENVPDPYYGGSTGFDLVIDLLEESITNFLMSLRPDLFKKNKN